MPMFLSCIHPLHVKAALHVLKAANHMHLQEKTKEKYKREEIYALSHVHLQHVPAAQGA